MDFELREALTYLRDDANYKRKLLISAVLSCIPLVNFVLLGYGVDIYRNIISGKKNEDLQPEWENAGDFILKGVLSGCIAIGYGLACSVVVLLIGVVFGAGAIGDAVMGGEVQMPWAGKLVMGLLAYIGAQFFWSGYSLYSESLELSRSFRFIEVLLRMRTFGKSGAVAVAGWVVFVACASWITGFIPGGMYLCLMLSTYASLVLVHIMAQLSKTIVHPALGDVVNTEYMEHTLKVRAEEAKFEDEYGHQKQGGRKASHYADRQAETVLTWSTDSDVAELED